MQEVRLETQTPPVWGCSALEISQQPRTQSWDGSMAVKVWASGALSCGQRAGGRWCTQGAAGLSALEALPEPLLLIQAWLCPPQG